MSRPLAASFVFSALLPLSLAACASSTAGGGAAGSDDAGAQVADGASFTLQPGQSVALADDSRLRYLRLINDSRCPPDVQCVWAGDAVVAFEWSPPGGPAQPFELHAGKEPRSHAIGSRKVTLKSLERGEAPAATLVVESGA